MKKIMFVILLLALAGVVLTGCGSDDSDLQAFMNRDLDEVRDLLGEEIRGEASSFYYRTYDFADGLWIGIDEDGGILSLFMEYGLAKDRTVYHFGGIDGRSTYDDVVAAFGDVPDDIRSGDDEERVGAVKAYGYWTEDYDFVRFFFDADDAVVAISFFSVGF